MVDDAAAYPSRRVVNLRLSNLRLSQVYLGRHLNLIIFSQDDDILTASSDMAYTGVGTETLMNAGERLILYGDRQEHIALQAANVNNARVRLIVW